MFVGVSSFLMYLTTNGSRSLSTFYCQRLITHILKSMHSTYPRSLDDTDVYCYDITRQVLDSFPYRVQYTRMALFHVLYLIYFIKTFIKRYVICHETSLMITL